MQPQIVKSVLDKDVFSDLLNHVTQVRRIFEGTPYHDINEPLCNKFNRYYWHNLPVLVEIHQDLKERASDIFQQRVKPSYAFLSMYGEGGVCPLHTDRPQCKFTIDLCISQAQPWGIFVNDIEYLLNPGEALCYSGTDHPHYRNTIQTGNFCNLAFFHFVPYDFKGPLS